MCVRPPQQHPHPSADISPLGGLLGLLAIAAIVCSAIGLGTFNADTQKRKWMAGWGLGLGILYTLIYMQSYG